MAKSLPWFLLLVVMMAALWLIFRTQSQNLQDPNLEPENASEVSLAPVFEMEAKLAASEQSRSSISELNSVPSEAGPSKERVYRLQVVDAHGIPKQGIRVDLIQFKDSSRPFRTFLTKGKKGIASFFPWPPAIPWERKDMDFWKFHLHVVGQSPIIEDVRSHSEGIHVLSLKDVGFLRIRLDGTEELAGRLLIKSNQHRILDQSLSWNSSSQWLPLVALNQNFQAHLITDDGKHWEWSGSGPKVQGEVKDVTLTANRILFLKGRIVDASGTGIGNLSWKASLIYTRGSHQFILDTDQEGRFRHEFPLPQRQESLSIERFSIQPARSLWRRGPSKMRASVRNVGTFTPGELDMGDLVLEKPKPLVAGKVVDHQGKGIQGVGIKIEYQELWNEPEPKGFWLPLPMDDMISSRANGSFEALADDPGKPLRVRVSSSAYPRKDPQAFQAFEQNLRIVLEPGGAFAGKLKLPNGAVFEEGIRIPVRFKLKEETSGETYRVHFRGGVGEFSRDGISGGTYLGQLLFLNDAVLANYTSLVVEPGKTTRDPRFQPLDLGALLKFEKIAVFDSEGIPLTGRAKFSCIGKRGHSASSFGTKKWSEGRYGLWVPRSSSQKFLIQADGFLPAYWESGSGVHEIRLKRPIKVTLKLPRTFPATSLGHVLSLQVDWKLKQESRERGPFWPKVEVRGNLQDDTTLKATIPGAGIYVVSWLEHVGKEGKFVRQVFGEEIEVRESWKDWVYELTVPEDFRDWPQPY